MCNNWFLKIEYFVIWSCCPLLQIKFGSTTYKTEVCRKSLNPQWNSEWYRFEVRYGLSIHKTVLNCFETFVSGACVMFCCTASTCNCLLSMSSRTCGQNVTDYNFVSSKSTMSILLSEFGYRWVCRMLSLSSTQNTVVLFLLGWWWRLARWTSTDKVFLYAV